MTDAVAASTQVALLSLVFFCCPGLFNALSSIASGLQDVTVAFRGNVLVYLLFTASSAVAAALLPTLGARRALALGTIGYVLYTLSLWNLSVTAAAAGSQSAVALFYVASGVLGVSAGFLWTAQGQMIMGYATERNQGRYLSAFWVVFNLGATCGGLLTCALNWTSANERAGDGATAARVGASNATFAAFVAVSALGAALAVTTIAPLSSVVKEDGARVATQAAKGSHWRDDVRALLAYATTSREIARLLPFFVYSNWFYTYHAFFNAAVFNTRTGGLASAAYWTAQMLAALALGRWLDESASSASSARRHAGATLGMLALLWNAMWALGGVAQYSLSLSDARPLTLDIVDDTARVLVPLALYIVYGAGDALGQVWIYWFLSAVSPNGRDPRTAGFNAGIYKCVQALSAALAWWIGAQRTAPTTQLWTNWALCNAAIAGAAWSLRGGHTHNEHAEALHVITTIEPHKSYRSTQESEPCV